MPYLAYCGLKCHECPLHIATQNNDTELKKKLMVEYSNDFCTFYMEDMNCDGCHSTKVKDSKMCGDCKIRACASQKSIETCAECEKYPCDIIEKYAPTGSDNRGLLDELYQSR